MMWGKGSTFLVFYLLVLFTKSTWCAKILVISPISSTSEANFFQSIAKELHSRGHEIVYVAPSKATIENATTAHRFTQVIPVKPTELSEMVVSDDILEQRIRGKRQFTFTYDPGFIFTRCHATFQNKEFQTQVLNKSRGYFDLVISYGFVSNCFDGIIHKLGAPFIIVTPLPVPWWIGSLSGFYQPTTFVPVSISTLMDEMTFYERLLNTWTAFYFGLSDDYVMQDKYTKLYRQYMGDDIPPAWEIRKDVSLILSNSHFSLNFPRPMLPDMVEIGGFHCKPAKKLPKDIENFVSDAKDGFIYFSMGTFAKSTNMNETMKRTFINVFSRLKQKVLWKFENDTMPNLPKNLKVSKWYPQQDILGHSNIRIFITHGGLFSLQEAVYHGVPLISLPIVGDQDANSKNMERMGLGIFVEILELSEESLENAIHKILNNKTYAVQSSKFSKIFRDQPISPKDNAMYWIEYVMKYKGAQHLRSAARNLNYIQSSGLDIITFLLACVLFFFGFLFFVVKMIIFPVFESNFGKGMSFLEEIPIISSKLPKSNKKKN